MIKHVILTAALAALLPSAAFAADAIPDDHWSGTGEVGLAIAKGNTDSQSLVGKLGAKRKYGAWTYAAGLSTLYAKSNGLESAKRYDAFISVGRDLSANSYLAANLRHDRDQFAANEYEWVGSVNYGYRAIATPATKLTFEVGPGYRWSKLQGVQVHTKEAILRGAMLFKHEFNDRTALYDDLLVETGKSNTFLSNDAGVMVKMSDKLALKAGVLVRRNSHVIAPLKNTDTLTTVNVVYGF